MSYEQVAERIKTLPENYLTSIMGFIDLLQSHDEVEQEKESEKSIDFSFVDDMFGIISDEEADEMRKHCHLKFKEIEA